MPGVSNTRAWPRRARTWLPLALAAPLVACGPKQPHFIDLMHAPHPWNGVVFCNIEDRAGRHCATAEDKAQGIRMAAAAEAMAAGKQSMIALDDSPEALVRCNGEPEAVPFWSFFPRGIGLCAGCGGFQTNDDVNALCHGMCEMEVTNSANPAPPDVVEFCAAHSYVAVNAT